MTRRTLTLPLLALVALVVSGCVGIRTDTAQQLGTISDTVRVTTELCPEGGTGTAPDVDPDATEEDPCDEDEVPDAAQYLIAYRVPAGTEGPATVPATAVDDKNAAVAITFRRSAEYGEQLAEMTADGEDYEKFGKAGTRWIGYVSDLIGEDVVRDITVRADLKAPRAASFEHLTVVGSRESDSPNPVIRAARAKERQAVVRRIARKRGLRLGVPTVDPLPADRPVDCDEGVDIGFIGSPIGVFPTTFCLSDPELPTSDTLQLRDLKVSGGEGFAEQGSTASVPFGLETSGPASSANDVQFTATTALAGATATPKQATTDLPTGKADRPVAVTVPADAAPGTYAVTLTAKVGDETRTATGSVVVLPKPAVATAPVKPLVRDNLYLGGDGSVAFGFVCGTLCGDLQADLLTMKAGIAPQANTAAVSKPRLLRVGSLKFKATAGKRVREKVALYPKALRAVRGGRTVKAILVVRQRGTGAPVIRRVTLQRRR
jgi:hypothetical protein